ncbi:hypothetical protein EV2_012327 [Malus domestica]
MMDHEALLRSKTAQQHRLAATSQLMEASANSFPYSSKCMNFLLQQQHFLSPLSAACGLGSLISTIFLDTRGIEPELCFTRILHFRETRVMRRQRKMRRAATRRQRTRMAITA